MPLTSVANPRKNRRNNHSTMTVAERLTAIRATLPAGVELLAVSKFHPVEAVREAYDAGQRLFGESRALEMRDKAAVLPDDIVWHFIGHLQTNKVKPVVAVADVIESVDSERLLRLIDAEAVKAGRHVDVLLQVHVAAEETKFGFSPDEVTAFVTPRLLDELHGVTITGIMGMASNTDDTARIGRDFAALKSIFDTLARGVMAGNPRFKTLSMGMSHDYQIAIRYGSTLVRIGTDIFGERQ